MQFFLKYAPMSFALVATGVLCYQILATNEKPSKTSWLLWTILASITAGGMLQAGTLSLQMASVVVSDALILALTFAKGEWKKWSFTEVATMLLTVPIIGLWQWTNNPQVAIVLSLVAVLVASWPMTVDLWHRPLEQSPLAYSLMACSSGIQLLQLEVESVQWQTKSHAQPVVYTVCTIVFLALMVRGRAKRVLAAI